MPESTTTHHNKPQQSQETEFRATIIKAVSVTSGFVITSLLAASKAGLLNFRTYNELSDITFDNDTSMPGEISSTEDQEMV